MEARNIIINEQLLHFHVDRYFVVIDDVWDVKTIESIKLALVENNCGSRVITTTRKFDVAKETGEIYNLQPLSDDNSKKLFYTRVFGADRKYHDNQPYDVSDKFLKKCAGIPLAIITMSSLLAGKPEDEWSEVYKSIVSRYDKDNRDIEDAMLTLSLSYYDMPSHLRTCLLYLSTYPEDSFIDKETLIRKWIAEGFVYGKHGTRLFEIGESYFNDLVKRSMIQAEPDMSGFVYSCRVHDMVFDLMRKFSFEENFITLLDDNVEGTPAPSNTRRLALQNTTTKHIDFEDKVLEMPKVRSYIMLRSHSIDSMLEISRFKLLRVLDIENCSFKEGCNVEPIGSLLHLRYLGITKLPIQIGDLKLLQTLRVPGDSILPASMVLLTRLVHLYVGGSLPDGIGNLTSLEELRFGSAVKLERFVKELGSLRELRLLQFSASKDDMVDERVQINFVESLRNLQKIQHIQIMRGPLNINTATWKARGFAFSKLPSCINPSGLPNLSKLSLGVENMDEHDLKLLARLPALCVLILEIGCNVTVSNINNGDGFFQKLKSLVIIKATVQFEQLSKEDFNISFQIRRNYSAIPFGSRGKSKRGDVVPSGVMPSLERLGFFCLFVAIFQD